jgi:outer membrane protein OmpA-like peptidoglycan-associated protein
MSKAAEIMKYTLLVLSVIFLSGCIGKKNKQKKTAQKIKFEKQKNDRIKSYDFEVAPEKNEDINRAAVRESYNSIFADDDIEGSQETFEQYEASESFFKDTGDGSPIMHQSSIKQTKQEIILKIGTILFDFNVYKKIKDGQQAKLDEIVEKIKGSSLDKEFAGIIIKGHACNSEGSEEYNLQLSDKRANTIKKHIVKKLSEEKLEGLEVSSFGCGTSELLAHGNRKQQDPNRRAEIFIVFNK